MTAQPPALPQRAGRPRRRRRPAGAAPVVQPPEKFAHLTGDELFWALIGDGEEWDSERFAAESGRSIGRFRVWSSERNAVDAWQRKQAGDPDYQDDDITETYETDRTAPPPKRHIGQSPAWRAGAARAWMIQVGLMRRDGTFIPHKPGGRVAGQVDIDVRAPRPSEVRDTGPAILAEFRALRAKKVPAPEARAQLAAKYEITDKAVMRRLEAGRTAELEALQTEYRELLLAGQSAEDALHALSEKHQLSALVLRRRLEGGTKT